MQRFVINGIVMLFGQILNDGAFERLSPIVGELAGGFGACGAMLG